MKSSIKNSKKAEGMPWYIIAAVLALIFILLGLVIIANTGSGLREFIEKLKEFF
jgi:hypothetical protein